MKQTFTFLTILLIFISQVFGQVKTINKDGKAIILNDDGTWRYDDSNSETIPSLDCSDLITTYLDKVTGFTGRASKEPIIVSKDLKNGFRFYLIEKNSIFVINLTVFGANSCIDETNKMNILFRDGTRLEFINNADYNCDGKFYLFFGGLYGRIKLLEQLMTKEIEIMRIGTTQGSVDMDFTSENSLQFMKSLECLSSKKIEKETDPINIKPTIPEVKLTSNIVKDIDGNQYPISQIGIKLWMASNLKVTRYNNGDLISEIINDKKWLETNKSAWSIYDNSLKYGELLGNLYNGNSIIDERNICPVGWHVPTDSDWETLIKTLGSSNEASIKLKATKGWLTGMNGSNITGMNCLPGGSRNEIGGFYGAGKLSLWWSSTNDPSGLKLYARTLTNDKQDVLRYAANPKIGAYVRCVRD
jgi:uncharacterized protein (TIGR02145 family)